MKLQSAHQENLIALPTTEAKRVIETLPQDSSYNEIIRELIFDKMIKSGLEDSENNNLISNEEMKNKIEKW